MEDYRIVEFGKTACEAAVKGGAQHVDVLVQDSRSVSLEVEKNSVRTSDVEYDAGYCVRAFHDGGAGFSRGRGFAMDEAVKAGADGAEMAVESEPDPDFSALPLPGEYPRVEGLFDPAMRSFTPSRAIEWANTFIEAAREIEPEVIVKAGIGAGAEANALVNSNGIAICNSKSSISMYVFSVVARNGKVGSYYDYTRARRISDLKPPEEIAREATEKAVSFIDSKRMDSGKYPVVLGPLAAAGLLRSVVGAASAEEIQRGRSYLGGKRGEKIASELIDIREDPLAPGGLHSTDADGEGFPKSGFVIIENGVLANYLHNSYTANKAGEKNTGHASRGSYHSSVGIGATNMTIRPGGETEKDIIGGIKDGLYIFMGSVAPHGVTGQVSGTVDYGFRIIDGELACPVENVMIGGDVFNMLKSIESVSSDYREEAGNIMPSILLGGVNVASGG